MTNTIPNVPRDDLDLIRAALEGFKPCIARDDALRTVRALLSAPSPAGVDGLEVVGWYTEDHLDDKSATTYSREVADRWLAKGWPVNGIANESDAQAIIDGLRGENERIRLNIAEYNEAIACYQSERDQQAQRIGELEGLLLRVQVSLSLDDTEWGYSGAEKYKLLADIRAALSAGKEKQDEHS